jgi:hypothetical protein
MRGQLEWLDSLGHGPYEPPMSSRPRTGVPLPKRKSVAAKSWRSSLILKRAKVLGDVEAPSREAAEAAAVRTFNLSPEQRSRLVVQERG